MSGSLALLSGVGLLLLASVPLVTALWAVALVAWSTLAGIRAARWCGFADARPLDRVAVGYALGLFATLAIDQLFVTGLGVVWRWTAPAVLAPPALREAVLLVRAARGARVSPTVGLVVAGGALLAVGHEWIWSLPLGGAALAAAWLVTRRGRGVRLAVQLGMLGTSAAGTVVALVRRDGRWWLTQNDTHFYEALASSLERWGVRDFALAAGRTLRYHWFPYAWVGAIDRAAGADDYVVLTRVAPLAATVGILLSVAAIAARSVPLERLGWVVVVFTVSPVFGDWWRGIPLAMAGSFSQLFAMAWLVAVPVALLAWLEAPRRGRLAALGLLMLALVGGKANHAVIAAVVLAASWAVLARRGDARARPLLVGGALIAAAMAVLGRWLFGAATSLRFLPTDWVPYVQGDLYGRSLLARTVAAAVFLSAMVIVPIAAVAAARREGPRSREMSSVSIVVLAAGVILSAWGNRLHDLAPNGLFFVHSAVTLLSLGIAVHAGMTSWRRADVRHVRATAIVAALGGCAITLLIPDLNSGSTGAVWLRVSRSVVPVLVALTAVVLTRGAIHRRAAALSSLIVLTLLAQTARLTEIGWSMATRGPGATNSSPWSESDLVTAIRERSRTSEIIATNHLCASIECLRPDLSTDAAFAVAIERRFFVAAPLYSLSYSSEAKWEPSVETDRVAISIEFGRAPTAGLAATLRAAGVRWYVAERARSEGVDFSGVGDVRYENADYLVVELRDP